MSRIVYGGKNFYGVDVGILMLETSFPRIEGDIGNANTWKFPVRFKTVKGGTPQKVVLELTKKDIEPFIEAAKELEAEGVKIITTSCGFLSLFQKELAESVNIPVVTSALLFVPFLRNILRKNDKIGIMTANSITLTKQHLAAVGIGNWENVVIYGLQNEEMFTNFTVQNWNYVDIDKCKEELLLVTDKMMDENKDIRAIVLECTNMPPYTKYIQEKSGVPVFDIVTLINTIYESINHEDYLK